MAKLRAAMDAAFWDLSTPTPLTLDGVARSIPGDALPLRPSPSCLALRPQQLSFFRNAFPLGLVPSFSPSEIGSFAIQSLLASFATSNWWIGLMGQFRPKKLISSLKAEIAGIEEWEVSNVKDIAKHFWDKSLFSINLCTQLSLSPLSSLFFTTEAHGEKKGSRSKAMFMHKLENHDITLEAAWPELFLDSKGCYWDVPTSISLNLQSLMSESGFRYRLGLHQSSGQPSALSDACGSVPSSLMPGICAKAAFSYEKNKDFWRKEEENKDVKLKPSKVQPRLRPYDVQLGEPHAAISGLIGGSCTAWLSGNTATVNSSSEEENSTSAKSISNKGRHSPFEADAFGSFCYTLQQGTFRKPYLDLTRIDARVDISSASAFLKGAANFVAGFLRSRVEQESNLLAAPKLNLIFQQQVAGPIVFRLDSRLSPSSKNKAFLPQLEDVVYSLSYSLRLMRSGKIVAWFSPKRKEGMIELRVFEF